MHYRQYWVGAVLYFLAGSSSVQAQVPANSPAFRPSPPEIIYHSEIASSTGSSAENKPALDSTAIRHWVLLERSDPAISNDGRYVMYGIRNQPYGSTTLVLQSVDGAWKKELVGIKTGRFSADSRMFLYLDKNTLYILTPGTDEQRTIPRVSGFQTMEAGSEQWLFYLLVGDNRQLVAHNFNTGSEQKFDSVTDYKLYGKGGLLVLKRISGLNDHATTSLQIVSMPEWKTEIVWSSHPGEQLVNYTVDGIHKQCAMLVADTIDHQLPQYNILYYRSGMAGAVLAVNNHTPGIANGLILGPSADPAFSRDGRYLGFNLKELPPSAVTSRDAVQVDVWTYRDSIMMTRQLEDVVSGNVAKSYAAVVQIEPGGVGVRGQVVQLQETGEGLRQNIKQISGDYIVVERMLGGDRYWKNKFIYQAVSLKDGVRTNIYTSKGRGSLWISPLGQYMLYYGSDHQYYSYNFQTHETRRASYVAGVQWQLQIPTHPGAYDAEPEGFAGWVGKDAVALVYDNNDIWQLDLSGQRVPINITGGYGRGHHLKLRLVEESSVFEPDDTVLVSAFDPVNKYNGIYRLALNGKSSEMADLEMGPWTIYYNDGYNQAAICCSLGTLERYDFHPLKAENANVWLIKRQSETESPNYFVTNDFKIYHTVSNLHPEKAYNWVSAELLHWKQSEGVTGEGILYKPENFDAHKKYPVIIYYYETMAGRLHQFPMPEFMRLTDPNVAWFTSRGYLVFTPDILYIKDHLVQSVCNSVISAAKTLTLLPYVDGKKMAISSFSWGGTQTNWLITQTGLFAAAATGGGAAGADPVSAAFQIRFFEGKSDILVGNYVERLLGEFWRKPEAWLDISPVLRADKVTTPLLMMNNYRDPSWAQEIELFMALRRLDKRVWMLQYDNGTHGVSAGKDAEDFTVRYTQFFDHFLKGAPAPIWMTKGIPAKKKGIEKGYELDTKLAIP